jgi:hypothetical protein
MDIPIGTKIGKTMKGGEKTLQMVMSLLEKKGFNGYVIIKSEKDGENITSYMIVKDSEPRLGVREVITRSKKNAKKMVRKLYAGENTLNDIKLDSEEENATIEVHSGIDVDEIIARYGKKEKAAEDTGKKDSKRIGLFWGGKGAEDNIEKEALKEKLDNWKKDGYNVTSLETIFAKDLKVIKPVFENFEEDVQTLEEISGELEFLFLAGFQKEVKALRTKLMDPGQINYIRAEIESLENKRKGDAKETEITFGDEKPPGIDLQGGHCYLIKEEKLRKSMKLYVDTLKKGYKGYFITRTNPKHLKNIKELKNSTMIWLTDKESTKENTIPPVLERIIYEIGDFVKKEDKGCLILDGIEYLESNNSFDAVLRFIRRIIDEVSESKSIFLVTLGPRTLQEQELKILEREMESISLDEM